MDKPLYKIPSVKEINSLPWNGFNVVSTFSGCGGSCLGYRMAGFNVLWANEFVPKIQESYRANKTPDCVLNCQDIKGVSAESILGVLGLREGELDLFDDSPPCQAFSTAGQREKGWGKEKKYEHGAAQCNETLFSEYVRLLRGLLPKVFIAENVSGLVKGKAKGFFLEILKDLKDSGYNVEARVLDAQWPGVPQTRSRLIFMGTRLDLPIRPVFPKPFSYQYSVRDALPWITKSVQDPKGQFKKQIFSDKPHGAITCSNAHHIKVFHEAGGFSKKECLASPCPAITASQCRLSVQNSKQESRKFTIDEVRTLCSFPEDFVLVGSYAQQWHCLGNSVPPLMMRAIAETVRDEALAKLRQ